MPRKYLHNPRNVTAKMEPRTVELLDDLADRELVSRSELIRRAVHREIREKMFSTDGDGEDAAA